MDNNIQSESNNQDLIIEPPKVEALIEAPKLSRKNFIFNKKIFILLVGVISIIVLSAFAWLYFSKSILNQYQASVSLVSGQVEKSSSEGVWVELASGDGVSQGDLVRVNGLGKAVITLDDGSAIRLDDNSRIKLTSLDPKDIVITNEKGEIYTRVVKADRSFIVKIDNESYRAMGTAYKTINLDEQKGVFVYESKVKAVSANTEVDEGNKFYTLNKSDNALVNKVIEISADEINNDNFIQWNKTEDQKSTEFKKYMGVLKIVEVPKTIQEEVKTTETIQEQEKTETNNDTPSPAIEPSISLTGYASDKYVVLSWSSNNVDTSRGFKLVKSSSANPVYPGNSAVYVGSGSSYSWKITDGETYHFRICQYTGSGCGVYSNDIQVTAPVVADGVVSSITLSNTIGSGVSWVVSGYSDTGFKLVWSKTPNPTYPNRSSDRYNYYSSPTAVTGSITDFDGSGTYYVRVCEYLGGKCGIYSNEITIDL